jgi:hypothetical protein
MITLGGLLQANTEKIIRINRIALGNQITTINKIIKAPVRIGLTHRSGRE